MSSILSIGQFLIPGALTAVADNAKLNTVHALPDLRLAGGRLGDGVSLKLISPKQGTKHVASTKAHQSTQAASDPRYLRQGSRLCLRANIRCIVLIFLVAP